MYTNQEIIKRTQAVEGRSRNRAWKLAYLLEALRETQGNQTQAAIWMGVSDRSVRRWIKEMPEARTLYEAFNNG